MASKSISIYGNGLKQALSTIDNLSLTLQAWPWFPSDDVRKITNGKTHTTSPLSYLNNGYNGSLPGVPAPEAVYTVNSAMKIMPAPISITATDYLMRTARVKADNGKFIPDGFYALELPFELKVSSLQGFITSDTVDNIWFGVVPFKNPITIENNLLVLRVMCTGIIGTMSGEAFLYLKISPANTPTPGRYINLELEKTKGIGLDKGIVEKQLREKVLPPLEGVIDDYIYAQAKSELKPVDDLVKVLTGDKAMPETRGLLTAKIELTKDLIKFTFVVSYAMDENRVKKNKL